MWDIDTNLYEAWDELDNINNESTEQVKLVLVEADKLTKEAELIEAEQPEGTVEVPDRIKGDLARLIYRLEAGEEVVIDKNKDSDIIQAAIEATKKFSGSGKDSKWVYQLQLLINAYISEKAILNKLRARKSILYNAIINNMTSDSSVSNLALYKKFNFNNPNSHKQIYSAPDQNFEDTYKAAKKSKNDSDLAYKNYVDLDRQKADIYATNDIGETVAIEVKVTNNTTPKNFHSADIVLICDLATKAVYVKYRKSDSTYTNKKLLGTFKELALDLKFVTASSDVACFKLL